MRMCHFASWPQATHQNIIFVWLLDADTTEHTKKKNLRETFWGIAAAMYIERPSWCAYWRRPAMHSHGRCASGQFGGGCCLLRRPTLLWFCIISVQSVFGHKYRTVCDEMAHSILPISWRTHHRRTMCRCSSIACVCIDDTYALYVSE